ncbi:MAG: Nif3-like dinuclear metal center hexameric protein [Bacteroidetes bacterium]|nr:Nif3-like dinuclear metal center hexameric protein [Bacteroidota bacterium]
MKVKEITDYLESIAPLAYQESYDNAGLICGNHSLDVNAVLICLDSTEAVIDEAIATGCNMVIAHHPIIFSGLKKFNGKNYVERVIIKAIQNNIAIYAAHTNLDNVLGGVNSKIAEKLGLINCKILAPQKGHLKRLITFCPKDKAELIRKALFAAGAGTIGNYDECSFNSEGTGTFRAGEGANPYVGEPGKQHREKETKIEVIYPVYLESHVINELIAVHPYEEVSYDLVPLTNVHDRVGAGIIGELASESDELSFLKHLKQAMKADCVRYTDLRNKKVKKVAVCGGSGSFLLPNAIQCGADVFVTSDFKYHQFFDAEKGIIIADIGHYESEQYTMELFYELLKKKFNTFALHLSKINTNPIKYL